ncbi:MAG: MerR family transcriptional regulator [Raoultibacter sp.]
MAEAALLTVGELARRVGVTVRTIQYYDQEGLLAPSAKGPQNQRLYAEENIAELYRILTLKYLGLSLAQVKAEAAHFSSGEALHPLADGQMDDIEKSFQQLFKRLTTLRALRDATDDADAIDWEQTAATIESCQDESQFFWRLTCISDASLDEVAQQDRALREESISKWHELIADTIRLMSRHEPLDSERNRGLAQRYLELDESQQALSAEQNFILMENIAPHGHDGSFDELRQTVCDYLETLVVAYRSTAT